MALVCMEASSSILAATASSQLSDDISDCTTISSFSLCSPSSSWTTDVNQDQSTEFGSGDDISDGDTKQSRFPKKHRRAPPPIFFGTPCKVEHERRAKYETKMRTRRLLRRDSLELARRKSGGNERVGEVEKRGSTVEIVGEFSYPEMLAEGNLHAIHSSSPDPILENSGTLKDISMVSLPEGFFDQGDEDHTDAGSWSDKESSNESQNTTESEGGDSLSACDRTIRLSTEITRSGLTLPKKEVDLFLQGQLPSTPTRHRVKASISRPSLAPSDADSSPGIPLAPYPTSARPSPLVQASPIDYHDISFAKSPYSQKQTAISPIKLDGSIKRDRVCVSDVSKTRIALQESPSKLNQVYSPLKNSCQSSSPNKVVVRQTLSAWAHGKLKTPQSPEKKEWDMMRAEATSPVRPKVGIAIESSTSQRSKSDLVKGSLHRTTAEKPIRVPQQKGDVGVGQIRVAPQGQMSRPPSRIARPVPVSRLPKPVSKVNAKIPTENLKRVPVANSVQPVRRFAASTLSSASRMASSTPLSSSSMTRQPLPAARIQSTNGPARVNVNTTKSFDRNFTVRAAVTSSPTRVERSRPIQKALTLSSSPVKRPVAAIKAISAQPIVRDARLISTPRLAPESIVAPSPSPAIKKDHSSMPFPARASAGVGPAQRATVEPQESNDKENVPSNMTMTPNNDRERKVKPAIDLKMEDGEKLLHRELLLAASPVKVVVAASNTSPLESGRPLRHPRRVQEKQTAVKLRKPTQSSILPSSTTGILANGPQEALPLSKIELSKLTSLNTHRNEIFVSQIETIVVRKHGENRPASPSSKIRKSVNSVAGSSGNLEASKEARERRARKRTPEVEESGEEGMLKHSRETGSKGHQLAAGDEEVYLSPPRNAVESSGKSQRVRWQRPLFCASSEQEFHRQRIIERQIPRPPRKGCLSSSSKSISLDRLGNVSDANQPWSPRIMKNKVTVYKVIYDDDDD